MQSVTMNSTPNPSAEKRITGRTVLGWLVGFFAVIIVANVIFMWLALSSFSGIEATSAYKAGQTFDHDKVDASAQAERGWQVSADIARGGQGADIRVHARDKNGAPLTGMSFSAVFKRPVEDGSDIPVSLSEGETGVYSGRVDEIGSGQWTVVLSGEGIDPQTGAQQRMFLSQNRINLRD
ncbi:MAG: FixH family protein [Rhodobiaceae bacterium]|nr:FixH family protein [Rhodobiaceae bacterium]MCC0051684.1 FixH family protein [Rhodobiaceae bacterium]MCC0061992.1 FixH family protein [Rhodobiaceae bacterium]